MNDANDSPVASYAYDYLGRRISKTIYGSPNVVTKYAYDGDRILAEYDGSGTLRRKFIYGPGMDEPICLIEVADNNAVYYYHFDGLGSGVALSDVQSLRYSLGVVGERERRRRNHWACGMWRRAGCVDDLLCVDSARPGTAGLRRAGRLRAGEV